MQIQLKESEIVEAVRNYISKLGVTIPVTDIQFSQGRNPAVLTATIELNDASTKQPASVAQRAPAVSEPAEQVEDSDTQLAPEAAVPTETGETVASAAPKRKLFGAQ